MKKLTIVFPGSYMNYRSIEEDMQEEYQAVKETGLFDLCLFNYDEWLAGDRFRITDVEDASARSIYRGWMMKPEEYSRFYEELKNRGLTLITDPDSYANMHLFPNVYPHIDADTAGMMIFEDGKVDVSLAKKQFRRFMVKDSVKSVKGTEFPAFFDQTITQEKFDGWMQVFYKYRGDLLTGGICIKEYLELKRYGGCTNEFRVFYANHQVISISKNSNQPEYTAELPMDLIEKYKDLNSPYYTVDFAELADGSWKIIEAGDGGVSGLSPGQDMNAYFRALYQAFE
jgi:hypothetical protein